MSRAFHEQPFDDETRLKLNIFRGYIREWLPVFMTETPNQGHITSVNIFDFFAGPGSDPVSNPGSPLIIQEEIRKFCEALPSLKNDKPITMYFNDKDTAKIEVLRTRVGGNLCRHGCCHPEFISKPFSEAFEKWLPLIKQPGSANLVIMDQFGIKDVTPEVVRRLAGCPRTDILFFFPSSFMHRFREEPAFADKHDLAGVDLDYQTIHRDICNYFKGNLGGRKYYLAPFSIKKTASIHGVIFGSSDLYGLEKFLKICWKLDPETGDKNYNMDGDPFRGETPTLFPELKTFRKIDQFKADLLEYIRNIQPDNLGMYEFCLLKGFPPSKAKEALKELQESGDIFTVPKAGQRAQKGAFYLNHEVMISKISFQVSKGKP